VLDPTKQTASNPGSLNPASIAFPDLISPNEQWLGTPGNTNELWIRQNTGNFTFGTSNSSSLTPNNYTSTQLTNLNNAAYASWFNANGLGIYGGMSSMQKTFNIDVYPGDGVLPTDGSWSSLLNTAGSGTNSDSSSTLVVRDDRGQGPNFQVSVKMLRNDYDGQNDENPENTATYGTAAPANNPSKSNALQYNWVDPTSGTAKVLSVGSALPIITVKGPSDSATTMTGSDGSSNASGWCKMTAAGTFYTMTIPANKGLVVQANNKLQKPATSGSVGAFLYTIANGPA
jgi:hypothetical protein